MTVQRDLTVGERDVLLKLLGEITFPGAGELRAQLPATKVIGGLPTFLDLAVDRSAPRADHPNGPIPGRAFVVGEAGQPEGELLVWVKEGYLSRLEFAWITDEPPDKMPPAERIRVMDVPRGHMLEEEIVTVKRSAVRCAREIVEGVVSPSEGARKIWMDIWPQIAGHDPAADRLLEFIGEVTEWEDHPEARDEIEQAIRRKAADLDAEWADDSSDG
jgi:hypothetical protein